MSDKVETLQRIYEKLRLAREDAIKDGNPNKAERFDQLMLKTANAIVDNIQLD